MDKTISCSWTQERPDVLEIQSEQNIFKFYFKCFENDIQIRHLDIAFVGVDGFNSFLDYSEIGLGFFLDEYSKLFFEKLKNKDFVDFKKAFSLVGTEIECVVLDSYLDVFDEEKKQKLVEHAFELCFYFVKNVVPIWIKESSL